MPYSEVEPASLPTTIYQYTSCKTLSDFRPGWPVALLTRFLARRFLERPRPFAIRTGEGSLRIVESSLVLPVRGGPTTTENLTSSPRRPHDKEEISPPPSQGTFSVWTKDRGCSTPAVFRIFNTDRTTYQP